MLLPAGMASLAFAKGFPWPDRVAPPSATTAFFNSITEFLSIKTPDALFAVVAAASGSALLLGLARHSYDKFEHGIVRKLVGGFCWVIVVFGAMPITEVTLLHARLSFCHP